MTTAFPFGLVKGLVTTNYTSGIFFGAVFGLFMTFLIMWTYEKYLIRRGLTTEVGEAVLTLDLNAKEALVATKQALQKVDAIVVMSNEHTGEVLAKTKASWKTWGERIAILIRETETGETEIHLKSEPFVQKEILSNKSVETVKALVAAINGYRPIL